MWIVCVVGLCVGVCVCGVFGGVRVLGVCVLWVCGVCVCWVCISYDFHDTQLFPYTTLTDFSL